MNSNLLFTSLLGIGSSVAAELVTFLNKKLTGTVLQGNGAFVVAFLAAVLGAGVKVAYNGGYSLSGVAGLSNAFAQVFAVSQIYFYLVAKTFNLKVSDK